MRFISLAHMMRPLRGAAMPIFWLPRSNALAMKVDDFAIRIFL